MRTLWTARRVFITAIWTVLGIIATALMSLAVFMLFRSNVFSAEPLTDKQIEAVWAFLGVSLGAVVTLFGTLLAEEAKRRAEDRDEREKRHQEMSNALAAAEQRNQFRETENRLKLDTRTKVLDLISLKEGQSSVGLVGGAMGTLMELGGGPVAIRILGDLWHEGKVGTSTAVWLINEILAVPRAGDRGSTLARGGDTTVQADSDDANVKPASGDASVQAEGDDEKVQAATLLYYCAGKLVPTKVTGHEARWYEWPDVAEEKWPLTLPEGARSSLILAVYALLTSRPPGFWRSGYYLFPIRVLVNAMQDPWVNVFAAKLLKQLDDFGFLSDMDSPLSEEDSQKMQELCALESSKFVLVLIADFRAWATGGHRRGIPRRHSAVGGQSERE